MTRDEVLERLTSVFRSIFDDDSITLKDSTTANDIEEWDSLNQIKIILASEQAFGLRLNARKISTFANVGDMVEYVFHEARQQGKA
jgi:acyl carrier protein